MNALIYKHKPIFGISNYCRTVNYSKSSVLRSYKTRKSKLYSLNDGLPSTLSTTNPHYNSATFRFALANRISSPNFLDASKICVAAQNTLYGTSSSLRYFNTSSRLCEQHSSKVEATVKTMKEKEKEKLKEEAKVATSGASDALLSEAVRTTTTGDQQATKPTTTTQAVTAVEPVVKKKSIPQRVWEELVHYYHGFRLLFIDINICRKLLWQVLNGESLTRREHRLLIRTTSDLFRLVPFSVFIIVPFMELLLPLAIKFFPGMLPSTFQSAKDNEDKIKQNLKVKLEMAKFLQKTLDEMSLQGKDHRSEEAKQFTQFFTKIRTSGHQASNDEIMKFSKLFEDEITLDSLSRQQLTALCRVLETTTIGPTNLLRFQLRMKLRSLAADDRMIQKEGIESLTLSELQAACRARGMRAFGISEERLKFQLLEWINLSLNEKVPPSLLLLSRALMLPEHVPTSEKLKETISTLPEAIVTQTKAAIGEREGKIDNRTKIEIIREEQRKIKEEKEEQKEEEKEKLDAEILADKAQTITADDGIKKPEPIVMHTVIEPIVTAASTAAASAAEQEKETISTKDIEVLGDALDTLSKDTKKLIVEKEEIKDLKEEIADYQEDVQELNEVLTTAPEKVEIKESKAAKNLFKQVNSMIGKLEQELAKEEKKLKETVEHEHGKEKEQELIHIDALLQAVQQIQKVPDDSRLELIHKILDKFDIDQDGHVRVDDVLKVIETIGKENVKLNSKQLDELIELMTKEEMLENEEKLEKALAKNKPKEEVVLKDKGINITDDTGLGIGDTLSKKLEDSKKAENLKESAVLEAIEKQTEKILPKQETPPIPPPQIPTSSTSNPKDKML